MDPLTIRRDTIVKASLDDTWRCLTAPAIVSEWFASTESIGPDGPVLFDFGDGDFFAGRVTDWQPRAGLRLDWRFWDVGPSYDIRYLLTRAGEGTQVTVTDTGAGTEEEAASLCEGWDDFLTRLRHRAETGQACRYRWTDTIGSTCFAEDVAALRARLADAAWWRARFPGAHLTLRSEEAGRAGHDAAYALEMTAPDWHGIVTQARVRFDSHLDRSCLRVTHTGWAALPHDIQVGIRRRQAERWRDFLAAVEAEFASASRHAVASR
jgi:uncharacterized protein YndB with AHSA1/START domain